MKELFLALDGENRLRDFRKKFEDSSTKSIDLFMARNPKLAPVGKCIIAFEMFRAESRSLFRERVEWEQGRRKRFQEFRSLEWFLNYKDFQGGDWYSYFFDRLTTGITGIENLPDFSKGEITFITFNYDRSLEYFLYESFRNSFLDIQETQIIQCLKSLRILHVYGQIAPLKWQDSTQGVDYRPPINASLLHSASLNIRTIYEEQQNPELMAARDLISQADQIFFLGFGYAPENMEVLGLSGLIPAGNCCVYGTAFGWREKELIRVRNKIKDVLKANEIVFKHKERVVIESMDCLELLRNYL